MEWGETIAYMRGPEGTMLLVIQADQPSGSRPCPHNLASVR